MEKDDEIKEQCDCCEHEHENEHCNNEHCHDECCCDEQCNDENCHDECCCDDHCNDEDCHDECCCDDHCDDEDCHDECCCDDHCHDKHSHGVELEVGCGCGCGCHSHKYEEKEKSSKVFEIIILVLSFLLLIAGLMPFLNEYIKFAFFLSSAVLSGYELIPEAFESLKKLKLDENLLMLVAIVSAFVIGEGVEAAAVSLFYKIGESFEDYAVSKSKKAIESLYEITSETAVILNESGSSETVDVIRVKTGDTLIISPYEKVPVDCVAIEDGGSVDASAVTGESAPVNITEGISVLSGSVNGASALKLKATAEFENSTASKIIKTVEESQHAKGNTDRFITKFAAIYTPVVVVLAVLLAVIPSLITGEWANYIHRALVFLVASCPCALVLSIPLGFFAAIGAQSKKGIIVKGGKFIEELAKVDTVLFDKTGTLTDNEFEIDKIYAFNGFSEENVLTIAAYGEKYSTHPLAQTIVKACPDIDENKIRDFKEIPGNGTSISLGGEAVLCGSKKFMEENSVNTENVPSAQVFVAVDGVLSGAIVLSGKLRESSGTTIDSLYKLGMKNIVMLTGDNEAAAEAIAQKCGIADYHAGLLPEQKTEILEKYKSDGCLTAFVGDGINDAPTLACADVGIAMGSGTQAAIEVGDVVLMNSNPENIASSVKMSRHAMRVIKFNIAFAVLVKIAVLILGALGSAPMWAAVFADVGVCIIAVLNASRLLLYKKQ